MDCVSPSTECFYTPLLGPDRDPLDEDPLDGDPLDKDPFDGDPLDEDPFDRNPLDKDPFNRDPFRSLVQPALVMLLPPKGIYPLFNELYKSIQAFAKEH
jgi:hypothetical protein